MIDDPFEEPKVNESQTPQLKQEEKGYLRYEEYIKLKDDTKLVQKIQE